MKKQLAAAALILSLTLSASPAFARERAPIKVRDVKFDRTARGWITADVEFQAGDFAQGEKARKKDYLSRIKLTLTTGYEDRDLANSRKATAEQKEFPYEFYQRSVELASVKRSRLITVRFFLPPAVVESKGFPAKPFAWMLGWEVEGLEMPVDPKRFPDNFSRELHDPKVLTVFQNFLNKNKESNAGVMLAQYHGPGSLQPKTSKDFAFIRKGED
ncbi:MAG: hypothetical protein ACR2RV_05240 [Verrucomicrobiales bacterium]